MHRLDADGTLDVFSERLRNFPNGCAVTADGRHLWMVESHSPTVNRFELATGALEEVTRLPGTVPDGIAFTDDGGVVVSCYRPDRIVHIDRDGHAETIAEDPQGTLLSAPTNVVFVGERRDRLISANLGRWHLTSISDLGLRGAPSPPPRALGGRRVSDFVPRYFTIEQSLRSRIAGLDAHAALPSDAQLCEEFDVSRMTARGAVQRLVQEGLVYRVPGRGTFVAPASANRTASRILSFSDEMRRSGRVPHSRVVSSGRRAASDDESRRLATDEVFAVRRVREADGEPVALETAVFPAARAEALAGRDLEDVSLFAALTEAGHVPTAGTAQLNAERATAEDAKLLGVRAGEPLLVERRLINDQDGVPLELTESRYVGTRYGLDVDFEVELPR